MDPHTAEETKGEDVALTVDVNYETLSDVVVRWNQAIEGAEALLVRYSRKGGFFASSRAGKVLPPASTNCVIADLNPSDRYIITLEKGTLEAEAEDPQQLMDATDYTWKVVATREFSMVKELTVEYDPLFATDAIVKWERVLPANALRLCWYEPGILTHGRHRYSNILNGAATEMKLAELPERVTVRIQLEKGTRKAGSDASIPDHEDFNWKVVGEASLVTVERKMNEEIKKLKEQLQENVEDTQVPQLEGKVKSLEEDLSKTSQELSELKAELKDAKVSHQKEVTHLRAEKDEALAKSAMLERELKQQHEEHEAAASTTKKHEDAVSQLQSQLREVEAELLEAKSNASDLEAAKDEAESTVKRLTQEADDLKAEVERSAEELALNTRALEDYKMRLEEASQAKEEGREEYSELDHQNSALQSTVEELQDMVRELETKLAEKESAAAVATTPDKKAGEELEEVTQLLRERTSEIGKLKSEMGAKDEELACFRKEFSKKVVEATDLRVKVEELEAYTARWKQLVEDKDEAMFRLEKEVRELKFAAKAADDSYALRSEITDLREANARATQLLEEQEKQFAQFKKEAEEAKKTAAATSPNVVRLEEEVAQLQREKTMAQQRERQFSKLEEELLEARSQVMAAQEAKRKLQESQDEMLAQEVAKAYEEGKQATAGTASQRTSESEKLRRELRKLQGMNEKYRAEIYRKIGPVGAVLARISRKGKLVNAMDQFRDKLESHIAKLLDLSGENVDLVADVVADGGSVAVQTNALLEKLGQTGEAEPLR